MSDSPTVGAQKALALCSMVVPALTTLIANEPDAKVREKLQEAKANILQAIVATSDWMDANGMPQTLPPEMLKWAASEAEKLARMYGLYE